MLNSLKPYHKVGKKIISKIHLTRLLSNIFVLFNSDLGRSYSASEFSLRAGNATTKNLMIKPSAGTLLSSNKHYTIIKNSIYRKQ